MTTLVESISAQDSVESLEKIASPRYPLTQIEAELQTCSSRYQL